MTRHSYPVSARPIRFIAALTAVLLASAGIVAASETSAVAASGTVSGIVFRDFNANGVRDTGAAARTGIANDIGLAGVTATAFDADGAAVGTSVSVASGAYSIPVVGARTSQVRIEFTNLPAGYQPSPVFGTSSPRTGSSVQFASIGATAIDFAASLPEQYSQVAAPIITAIQYSGAPEFSGANSSRGNPAVVAAPYSTNRGANASTSTGTGAFPDRTTLATFGEVGAVWGSVFRPAQNDVLVSATYKRHSGLGSQGLGGIYRISNVLDASGQASDAGSVTPWLNVAAAPLSINVGTALSNAARDLTSANHAVIDADAFAKIGTVGIGGMAVSPDGKTLYFINLFDKNLYSIDVSTASAPTLIAKTPLGLTTGQRPWALTMHAGKMYVGYVTTGETTGFNPGQSAASAGLTASVMRTNLPVTAASTFGSVLSGMSLGYAKGDVYGNVLTPQSHRWNSWTSTWTWPGGRVAEPAGGWQIYPQAILSDLYFDESEFMTLAFSDRSAIQGGNRNLAADAAVTGYYEAGASGDILIAAPNSQSAPTTWTVENDSTVGNATVGTRTATLSTVLNQGPGGREFYNDRLNVGVGATHQEIGLGALAGIAGTREVVATTYDPLSGIRLAGVSWFNTVNGANIAGYEHTADPGGSTTPTTSGTFQKGGGLGAIQLLAEAAPIEIGNRVWFDADQDGVQDADEPPLSGVRVQLLKNGSVIHQVTTSATGNYYFSSDDASPFYVPGGAFTPNGGEYTVKFIAPTTGNVPFTGAAATTFGTVPWSAVSVTNDSSSGSTDVSDSNPDPTTGEYTFTVGDAGWVNHDIDAGYVANTSFTVTKELTGDGLPASGQIFTLNAAATDFRGDTADLGSATPIELEANETSAAISVAVGTSVTVTESGTTGYRSTQVVPSGATLVTAGATPFAFTVTNELFEPGQFRIAKTVTGPAASTVSSTQSFTANYTYPGMVGGPGVLTVVNGQTSAYSLPIPYGSTVTLSELTPVGAPASVGWDTPIWTDVAGNGSVITNTNGTATVTIDDASLLTVGLENPTQILLGGFSVTKVIGTDAAASVPGDFEFTVEYSIDGGVTWLEGTVSKDDPTMTVSGIAAGTTVMVREVAPGTAAPDVAWGTPVFSGTGVTATTAPDPEGASFVIGANATLAVTLTNPTTRLFGQFSLTKDVTGGAENTLTSGYLFTGTYTYPGQAAAETFSIANGQTFTSTPIPLGSEVTITETTPTGGLPAGSSWGTPRLVVGAIAQANGSTVTVSTSAVLAITLENPTDVTPRVSIVKGDELGYAADTAATGTSYTPGETRTIKITATNTGTDELENVILNDETLSGATIQALSWTLPDGSTLAATQSAAGWTATWPATTTWKPGAVISGTATLTVGLADAAHVNRITVTADGVFSGTPVTASNDYNAFTGAIQVIKYNGELTDPAVKSVSGDWVIPAKPLASPDQDANDADHAVVYPVDTARSVRWVVTNTGTTSLTNLTLVDVTSVGPSILDDWTADLSEFGGPADYSFVDDGPWAGILPPGASFFAEGSLTLAASAVHTDTVTVVGTIVTPEVDGNQVPTGNPALDSGGDPIVAVDDADDPITVTDNDPFRARTGIGPFVDIEKGDGTGTTITHDADTMPEAEYYAPGESRTIVFRVQNTGDEALRDVTLTDETLSGGRVQSLRWTFPDGSNATATLVGGVLTAEWAASFTGASSWAPNAYIYGTATLTVNSADAPHVDSAAVTARGVDSGTDVTDVDNYNAVTGAVQVIKYDGETPDPAVKDPLGNWITPSKDDMNTAQDADTDATAVEVAPGSARTIRWVITNTGTTTLTNITVKDVTLKGPPIDPDWTSDLSAIGGPSNYSFVTDGPWAGELAPGQSFFSQGTYRLAAFQTHADNVDVIASIVVPETDSSGRPTGNALRNGAGGLVTLTDGAGIVRTVDGGDPFTARARLSLVITGIDLQIALVGALALVMLGLGIIVIGRRRKNARSEA
ncbi:MAG: DUF5979 domain-containing protein [Microbacteriaceae bacterium]